MCVCVWLCREKDGESLDAFGGSCDTEAGIVSLRIRRGRQRMIKFS